jgi:hypothetical protein
MQTECGSAEQWQRATTLAWIKRIKPLLSTGRSILFEGQMRICFIQEALAVSALTNARILLVDCDDATRTARLSRDRSQPELANADMLNWARYLRQEATAAKIEILNTGESPLNACIDHLVKLLS